MLQLIVLVYLSQSYGWQIPLAKFLMLPIHLPIGIASDITKHNELHDISVLHFHFTTLNNRVASAISKIIAGS